MTKIQLIVSRFNEEINYLNQSQFREIETIIYNKGPELDYKRNNLEIINLQNLGREFHTYLYHIINNYTNLADVTIFLPGSCRDPPVKLKKTNDVMNKVINTNTTVIFAQVDSKEIIETLDNFTLDVWIGANRRNRMLNSEKKLALSTIRPFGNWYKHHFSHINDGKLKIISFFGIFAIAKEHILQHPIEMYQKLLDELSVSSNPEVGHYMERAFPNIFLPYPDSCIYY